MGFDLFNYANNHTGDFGVEGMVETMNLLDSHNLVYGGAGMTAGEAAQARYYDTPKGRFAFIGLATSFTPASRAGDPRPEIKGRPGVNLADRAFAAARTGADRGTAEIREDRGSRWPGRPRGRRRSEGWR